MKLYLLKRVAVAALAVISLSALASAKGFTKSVKYTDGQFTDVSESAWYKEDVKSAYELGFVKGKSDNLYSPDGNVTVAEGITMATRVHAIYNNKAIAEKSGGKWYDMYVSYALENGMIENGQFTNYDRNIQRYEMALLFANSLPADYFTPKNAINDIPDVAHTEDYYDELMMLYKAGVVLGSDDYGNFYATNPIKRSETAAIINRVALPENRVTGTLKEYGDREQAVYLIDDSTMQRTPRNMKTNLASGWKYEDMGNIAVNTGNSTSKSFGDSSDKARVAIHRDITVQHKGKVSVEATFSVTVLDGFEIIFEDTEKEVLFKLAIKDGKYVAAGASEQAVSVQPSAVREFKRVFFELDLDKKTAKLVIDGVDAGTYTMSTKAKNIARMSYATTKEAKLMVTVDSTHMYVNYDVNDNFGYTPLSAKPYGWNVDGKVSVEKINSSAYEMNSVKMTGKSTASKKFDAVSGKFVYETFLLPTKTTTGYVAIKNGEKDAVKIDINASKFINGSETLREFDERVWQLIRIEGDTDGDKAVIKVNNKVITTVPLTEDSIDTVEIVNSCDEVLWFDDVEVYNTYDYTDYVAKPVPVTDDEWIVGMSVCSLWREGTHYGWDCISPYEDITPVLGYYDEGLPEVADWEIKFFTEHGYDFQHYCWYLGTLGRAPIKETSLSDAIIDGYMNAKYSDMMSMMIMWENQSCSMTSPEFFYDYVWPYWCEWYFSDARYLRIDNKAPITLYQYSKFIENMGGLEKAKQAVAFMREDIKRFGYDDIILLACPYFSGYTPEQMQEAKELGIEALVSYTFGDNAYDAQYQKDAMMRYYNDNVLPLVPSIGVGFNDIGWTEVRTPLATPEAHKEVMEWAKNTYLPLISAHEQKDWLGKFVFHTTWNEYGEGHYIMPSSLNKFGYVDANRAVFSSVAGKDDKMHFDIEPTDNQKARLCYLYPAKTVPMRKEGYISASDSIADNAVIKSWNFEEKSNAYYWEKMNYSTDPKFDENEKALVGSTTASDGNIRTIVTKDNVFNADDVRYLHVCIKHDAGKEIGMQMYFINENSEAWSEQKGYTIKRCLADGEYHDYYIDLSENSLWTGEIARLRFDPLTYAGNYYIKTIEFLADYSKDSIVLDIDGTTLSVADAFVERTADGLLIAGNPSDGFYSRLNLYYEYNRVNGTLDIYGNNGSKLSLVVGSEEIVIDGKTVKLSQPVKKIDGLVLVPVKLICETFGYQYTEDGQKVSIVAREKTQDNTGNEPEIKLANQYEFNTPGDTEGFKLSAASGNVIDGVLGITAKPVTYTSAGYDPQIVHDKDLHINTQVYNVITVRYRPTFSDNVENVSLTNFSIYFATAASSGLDEKKKFTIKMDTMTLDAEGFYTFEVDCTTNEAWTGIVNTLRFDPANIAGFYEFDYIRVSPNENTMLLLAEEQKKAEESNKKYEAAANGEPFYIDNADAEDLSNTINCRQGGTAGSTKVTIIEDDLREGNHAYLLEPDTTKETWTYFRAKTQFKAGVTYKVEFDIRILKDHLGNDGVGVTSKVNPRYTDIVSGATKSSADHPENKQVYKANASDGWVRTSVTFTISNNLDIRDNDEFSLFVDPQKVDGEYRNFSAMVDNFVVTVVE